MSWSQNNRPIMEAQERIQAGNRAGGNTTPKMRETSRPFGGYNESALAADGGSRLAESVPSNTRQKDG